MDREPPESFICPITQDVMEDPVLAPDTRTYERGAIEEALRRNPVSPITRQPMRAAQLVYNRALRDAIDAWLAEDLGQQPEQPGRDEVRSMAIAPERLDITVPQHILGRGSFGLVVAGTLATHGRRIQVAVKTLQGVPPEEAHGRLGAELRAHETAQQGAEGVCRLLGTCEKDGALHIVMKRYAGSLRDRLDTGPMEPDEVRRIGHALCRTLAQLHAVGVVVKDIKPENVLMDEHGQPALADFGISEVVTRTTRIMPTSIKGTFNYMAPEAFDVAGHGPEVDVWAIGCVIVEMCTGVMPFHGLQLQQVMLAVYTQRRTPDVPDHAPAADLVRRCFAFDRAERPSAEELAAALVPGAAELPELAGGMADVFARRVTQLTRELDTTKQERDMARRERDDALQGREAERTELLERCAAALEERDMARQERDDALHGRETERANSAANTQALAEARREIEQLRHRLATARSVPPAAAAAAPSQTRPASTVPPGAVFLVKNCGINGMNGYYVENGTRNGKEQFKKYGEERYKIYYASCWGAWGVGPWVGFEDGLWVNHPDTSAARPPCSGWKQRSSNSRMEIVYC
eukprot:m.108679 g.108679  ORF g.108679 m.108679 type:complete len:580 (-) comp10668_c1_seq1:2166-3905(-)